MDSRFRGNDNIGYNKTMQTIPDNKDKELIDKILKENNDLNEVAIELKRREEELIKKAKAPNTKNQSVQWEIADEVKEIDAAKLLLHKAIWAVENNSNEAKELVSMARIKALNSFEDKVKISELLKS